MLITKLLALIVKVLAAIRYRFYHWTDQALTARGQNVFS